MMNKIINTKIRSNTGVRGISLRSNGKYEALFSMFSGKVHIGTFNTLEEAKKARNRFINSLK